MGLELNSLERLLIWARYLLVLVFLCGLFGRVSFFVLWLLLFCVGISLKRCSTLWMRLLSGNVCSINPFLNFNGDFVGFYEFFVAVGVRIFLCFLVKVT